MSTDKFNVMQQVKRRFFSMRNGVIADVLRKGGSPYKIIFGLNIIQIKEIAEDFNNIEGLSQILWQNNTTRESMLLAPMLMNPSDMDYDEILKLVDESPDVECLDMLVHSLLRKVETKEDITIGLSNEIDWKPRYVSMRLAWTFLRNSRKIANQLAQKELERNDERTRYLAEKIIDELQLSF